MASATLVTLVSLQRVEFEGIEELGEAVTLQEGGGVSDSELPPQNRRLDLVGVFWT